MPDSAAPDHNAAPDIESARAIDELYRESDKLYYELARDCGISETAYWILYAIEVSGGSVTQHQIAERFSYSKQTVNSALKALEAKGLVGLSFAEGSRRSKVVSLTPAGCAFCDERIVPAIAAEDRAFTSLGPGERGELIRLVRLYTRAIDAELTKLREDREAQWAQEREAQWAQEREAQWAQERQAQ